LKRIIPIIAPIIARLSGGCRIWETYPSYVATKKTVPRYSVLVIGKSVPEIDAGFVSPLVHMVWTHY